MVKGLSVNFSDDFTLVKVERVAVLELTVILRFLKVDTLSLLYAQQVNPKLVKGFIFKQVEFTSLRHLDQCHVLSFLSLLLRASLTQGMQVLLLLEIIKVAFLYVVAFVIKDHVSVLELSEHELIIYELCHCYLVRKVVY